MILPPDDGLTLVDRAQAILGNRLKITKRGFFLDDHPVNTAAVLKAAGITPKEAPPM